MAIPIILYDENHERVGETYHRRAKQLVRSGRGHWLEEGHSMMLTSYLSAEKYPLPHSKEEVPTMTESVYNNNGIAYEEPKAPTTASNDLLMYLAKQNVAQKKSLIRHVVAYAIAWAVILSSLNFGGPAFRARPAFRASNVAVATNTTQEQQAMRNISVYEFRQPNAWFNVDEFLDELYRELQYELSYARFNVERALDELYNELRLFSPNNIPHELFVHESGTSYVITSPRRGFTLNQAGDMSVSAYSWPVTGSVRGNGLWHFVFGIMFAWVVWIAVRSFKVARRHLQNRAPSPPRPDPVAMEYQRLRSMSVDSPA